MLESEVCLDDEACGEGDAGGSDLGEVPASEGEGEDMDASEVSTGGDTSQEEEGGDQANGKATKSPRIQGLYKPPTHAELQSLKETQDLYKSNLMKLQVSPCRFMSTETWGHPANVPPRGLHPAESAPLPQGRQCPLLGSPPLRSPPPSLGMGGPQEPLQGMTPCPLREGDSTGGDFCRSDLWPS